MSLSRALKRSARIAAFLTEHAVEIVAALYACDEPHLAACVASQLGMREEEMLGGSPRPAAVPARAARAASDELRAMVVGELAKGGLTLEDIKRHALANAAEREARRRKAKEAKERRKAARLPSAR